MNLRQSWTMASFQPHQPRDWYQGTETAGESTADETHIYEAAKAKLLSVLSSKEREMILSENISSMKSLIYVLQQGKLHYDAKPACKARKWLVVLSSKLHHYGSVIDVLIQQNPQYTSLAWGAMKFLFMSVLNHEETTKELAKAYSMIADLLPRTDFTLVHYPTAGIKEVIAQLYAHIILFTSRAIAWYKKGKLSHVVGAIARPWALNWKDSVDEIAEQSRRVESLARVAAQAELRDTRMEVKALRSEVEVISAASTAAYTNINRLLTSLSMNSEQLHDFASRTHGLVQEIKPMLHAQRAEITKASLSHVLALPWTEEIPSPDVTLKFCTTMRTRRRLPALKLPEMNILQNWASNKQSTLLFISGSSTQASKDFTIDLAHLLRNSHIHTIWVFRYSNYWENIPTFTKIIQSITFQAISLFPACTTTGPSPISSAHLMEASTETDWIRILGRALSGVEQVHILLDAELLALAGDHHKYRITRWLENFINEMGRMAILKIFVSSSMIDKSYISGAWEQGSWVEVCTNYTPVSKRPVPGKLLPLSQRRGGIELNHRRHYLR